MSEADHRAAAPVGPVVLAFAAGSAVSVAMGAYAGLHHPTGTAVNLAGFSSPLAVKSWLASISLLFALIQVLTALAMYGRLPLRGRWVAFVHRWSGRIAVLVAVPVAVHCLYALGFQGYQPRILLHSLFGCFFFGAFVCKMLVLTRSKSPGWVVPVVGGALAAGLTMVWLTSALWFFSTFGVIR
ncbi:hypothetical protein JOE57_003563 [Microlunatus panaciterrae]|uniref:Uncharacterized protein n=1 Tax=Microlunatus panaciterrae TaxID=400768 RepID=A0ABS2RNS6_9ACTN|nr:hypothetical protein [Microlunatus panaciterrae]